MATTSKTTTKATPKAAATPAPKKVQAVDAAVMTGQETVDTVVKTSTAVAKKGVEKAVAMTEEQVAVAVKAGKDAYKGYEDMIAYSKSNYDAVVKANEIFAGGMRAFNQTLYNLVQSQLEANMALAHKVVGCDNFADAYALQSDAVKKSFVSGIEESRKLGDFTVKLAEEAGKPIAERVSITVDLITTPMTA